MTDLVRKDPFRSLFAWPRWPDEFDMASSTQRGLRIHETAKNIVVEAVVAGIPATEVDVNIEDGILTIKAEKREDDKKEGRQTHSYYSYYYTTALSGGQWDRAGAEVEDGVVKVTIPKEKAARPRKITVKAKKK
jgi:HSP20 family protein